MRILSFFTICKIVLRLGTLAFFSLLVLNSTSAQTRSKLPSPEELKKLSLEELMEMEVITLSKNPENLTEVASAIQIVTNQAILRSGATRLPEALRLAPNLQVAQSNSHDWAITARGFNGAPLANNTLANKLLVMIDGRSVYTPLFGGVFWDAQNVLLEDIERIEAVSGPGGTLWGENAINGIINVITKSSKETQGLYLSGAAGSFLRNWVGIRYGDEIGKNLYFRVYGQHFNQDNTHLIDSTETNDQWNTTQGGFRMDYYPSEKNAFMVEGNIYAGREGDSRTILDGQNLLTRWKHSFSGLSDIVLQVYFDRTWRILPDPDFSDELTTYDLDLQYYFPLGKWQNITLGLGYRFMHNKINNSNTLFFSPQTADFDLLSAFIQDEITLYPEKAKLYLGAKFTHNDFSGFGLQPNSRIAWTPNQKNTIWAGVTCALRSPSRFDADIYSQTISGNDDFDWERVIAYEAGYRMRPMTELSFSLAAFFNKYHDLRSINMNSANFPPLFFANDQKAETWGIELSGIFQVSEWWRLRGGYTLLKENIWAVSNEVIPESEHIEATDPENQILLQSMLDLPGKFQFDLVGRYVDKLPESAVTPAIPDYFTFDVRLAKRLGNVTISIVGRNLQKNKHTEFGSVEIPRNIFGKVTWRL